ncbi:cell division protein SepF, partial [Candidatus Woesearchaeota archaeon]|nr:cell division protein SepF [Candidatus Woesearchaeota archaeon]
GGGGGGSGTTGAAVKERGPQIFTIYNFPKELGNLIKGDRIQFEENGEWNIIDIENVNSNSVDADVLGKYVVFKEGDEREFALNGDRLFIRLTDVYSGMFGMRFDLVKALVLDAVIDIKESFEPGSNVSFTLGLEIEAETDIELTLFRNAEVVWNKEFTEKEPKVLLENIGVLEQGDYTLVVLLTSGSQTKTVEKQFTVAELQQPAPVERGLRDWLILILILLFCTGLIMGVEIITHNQQKEQEHIKKHGDDEAGKPEPVMQKQPISEKIGELKQKFTGAFTSLKSKVPKKKENVSAEEVQKVIEQSKKKPSMAAAAKFDTPDAKAGAYLPYEHLHDVKRFIEQYHDKNELTDELKQLHYVFQKLGFDVYSSPKQLSPNEVVRLNKLFNEKHDYLSYDDLVMAGSLVTRQLKRDFGSGEKKISGKGKQNVKYMTLEEPKDIEHALNDLRQGNVVILNINPLYMKNKQDLKAALSKLKATSNALGGKVALTFDNHVLATGSNADVANR